MSGELTELTEITTALGMLRTDIASGLTSRPVELRNVSDGVWTRLVDAFAEGQNLNAFTTAFANGQAFLTATDGLRGRRPLLVEWKGPHKPPGDEVIPADLRIDHVYLVSCKYLSKVLLNPGPSRLFDRLLIGDKRSTDNWFLVTAPDAFQALYDATRHHIGTEGLPERVSQLTRPEQRTIKAKLNTRAWPAHLKPHWERLCQEVSAASAARWSRALSSKRGRLFLLWKLLRISGATYFVLGTDKASHLRLRVGSSWDWMQAYELDAFTVAARPAGQPEVSWRADVRERASGRVITIDGHVEVRWSHGRFLGTPEAKVYLDTPHHNVPGYHPIH